MYAPYFGLLREPFSIAPDPRYLFMSERHREALAHLLYGVGGGGGFVLLTGEIGAGKTTVCRAFLEQIPAHCRVAYIFNPRLTVIELLQTVCDEFGIQAPPHPADSDGVKAYIDAINAFLLKAHALGQNCVLIIDEAQNLSSQVLEQLRLLTNLETTERKLLQIILIGQPELRGMLARPELEQLAQRVIARYHLQALSEPETAQYIAHRLAVAGLPSGSLFDAKALQRIHRITRGVPRRVNLLCDRALLGAYANERKSVDSATIDKAAGEVFGVVPVKRAEPAPAVHVVAHVPVWVWGLLGGVAIACFGGAAALAWMRLERPAPARLATPASQVHQKVAAAAAARISPTVTLPSAPSATRATTVLASTAELNAWLKAAPTHERQAWRELAPLWQIAVGESDPCRDALQQHVQCFKSSGGLTLITQLGRPCLLSLYDDQGRAVYALLTALSPQVATLRWGDATLNVPITELAKVWRGDFATLWRSPEGYRKRIEPGQSGPAVDWLAARMASLHHEAPPSGPQIYETALQAKVHAFQMAQGIKPDGMAGAMTIMQLNRATGVDEPRLKTEP